MRFRPRRRLTPEDVDRHWQRLLSLLEDWGTVREVAPGRVEVTITAWDEEPRQVTFVGSPEEWAVASRDGEGEHGVDEMVGAPEGDEIFVVWSDGRWRPSTREELPPVRSTLLAEQIARMRAEDPEADFGWYAYDPSDSERRRSSSP